MQSSFERACVRRFDLCIEIKIPPVNNRKKDSHGRTFIKKTQSQRPRDQVLARAYSMYHIYSICIYVCSITGKLVCAYLYLLAYLLYFTPSASSQFQFSRTKTIQSRQQQQQRLNGYYQHIRLMQKYLQLSIHLDRSESHRRLIFDLWNVDKPMEMINIER